MEPREVIWAGRREFGFRLLATLAAIIGLLALWHVSDFVLMAFGAVLFATLLNAPSRLLSRRAHLPYKLALAIVLVVFCGLLALAGWWLAPSVSQQFGALADRLPEALDRVVSKARQYSWVQSMIQEMPQLSDLLSNTRGAVGKVTQMIFSTVDAVTSVFVVLFVGIFLAASPTLYLNGVMHLFPKKRREQARMIFGEVGRTLRYWLVGQFCAMVLIGVATWAGLSLMGVKLAVALGFLAGLLEFIPNVGPVLSAIPAILIALLDGPREALYVALLYLGIQFAENNLVIPLVQRRAISLPPALSLLALLLFAKLFGFLGLLLAIPLTAAIFVFIKEAYVKRALHDPVE
jgi:predicted PurR-regulated permease PerM